MIISENYKRFQYFNFETGFLDSKRKPFSKNWSTISQLKALRSKTRHFHTKLPCQKSMLRQIEWWLQNGPITKNWVLPATNAVFWKLCFSFRTSYKELIWCTNNPISHICTFCKHWSFIWPCFFLWVSLNQFLFLTSFSTDRMPSFTEFATKPHWCGYNLNNGIMDSYQGNNYVSGLGDKKLKRHRSSYMMGKCTLMNVCNTFSQKQIDFASRMKSLHEIIANFPILGFSSKVIRE